MQLITSFSSILGFLFFIAFYFIYKYILRPFLWVNYYQRQGALTFFHRKLLSYPQNYQNALEKGDFYHLYNEALKHNPQARFIVENFGDKVLFIPVDSEMVKEILKRYEIYRKSSGSLGLISDLGYGTLTLAEGAQWRKKRRMVGNALNFEFIKAMVPVMAQVVQERFDDWERKGELVNTDLVVKMGTITGEIIGRFFFGKKFSDHRMWDMPMTAAAQKVFDDVGAEQFTLATAVFGPNFARRNILPRHKALTKEIKEFRGKCKQMLIETEEGQGEKGETNILKLLLEMEKNTPAEDKASHEQIVGEFLGLLIAGTDTTSLMVASAIYHFSKHPEVLMKVQKEVEREMKDLDNLSIENLNKMDYTTAVLKETLRMGAAVQAFFFREAVQDDILCGVKIKKGTIFNIFNVLPHNRECFYTSPKEFIPERWLNDSRFMKDGWKEDQYSFLSFSAGPRNCVGQHIAMVEGKIIVGAFLKRFRFEIPKDYEMRLVQKAVVVPVEPLLVTMERRNKVIR